MFIFSELGPSEGHSFSTYGPKGGGGGGKRFACANVFHSDVIICAYRGGGGGGGLKSGNLCVRTK